MLLKQLLILFIIATANWFVLGFDYGQKKEFNKNTKQYGYAKKNSSFSLNKRERSNLNNNKNQLIKCKYIFIDKAILNKQTSSFYKNKIELPGYFKKLYEIYSGYISLNSNYFTTYLDDCLDGNIADTINKFITETSTLYGVDLSSNSLDNPLFELILKNNYIFKHYSNQIRYLNLSDNSLVLESSNSIDNSLVSSDLSGPWSTLNSFTSLETLILDKNKKINLLELNNLSSLIKKLKIFSLNKCNLNESLRPLKPEGLQFSSLNESQFFYFGLSSNNFDDSKSDELTNAFGLILPNKIEILDLSFNKFNKVIKLFNNKFIYKLNLENNHIRLFNINEFLVKNKNLATSLELNLRNNFITNATRELFKSHVLSSMKRIEIKLQGNPIICDCNSLWLLDQANKFKSAQIAQNYLTTASLLDQSKINKTPKVRKLSTNTQDDSQIKFIFKRETEEISQHYNLNEGNFGLFMLRHKRVKSRSNQTAKSDTPQYSTITSIVDLDLLTCNYVDVFNFDEKVLINSIRNIDFDDSFASSLYNLQPEKHLNQNKTVLTKAYKKKLVLNSVYQDYMCSYEDYCRPECDCCMFLHCHCRSVCPNNCKCYYDNKGMQNIVDCGGSELNEVPDSPIELATDMRLNNNNIKIVKSHSFFGFGQLRAVFLQKNSLSYIAPDAFDDLRFTLKLLNLAHNQLNYLNGDEFNKLKELNLVILDNNPIKNIDNPYFFDINYLPNLKLISVTQTELAEDKINELIRYAESNMDLVVKHKKVELVNMLTTTSSSVKVLATNPTLISTTLVKKLKTENLEPKKDVYSLNSFSLTTMMSETQKTLSKNKTYGFMNYNNNTLLTKNKDKSEDLILKLLKTYMFQIIVFLVFFTLSLIAVLIVYLIAKNFDTNKPKKTKKQDYNCFKKNNKYTISATSSYFEPSSNHRTMNLIKNDSISEFEDQIEFNTAGKNNFISKIKCALKNKNSDDSFRPCHRRSSFDSTDTHTDCDSSSVPASRSIKSLHLNIFIYFNVNDNYYVTNFLIPTLKKCLTLVPNTRYIIMPMKTNFVTSNPETEFMATNFFKTNDSPFLNRTNSLNGKILVLSENFFEYKPADDLFKSLKQKTILNSNNNSYKGLEVSLTCNKKRGFKPNEEFKNSFRIYIEPNELTQSQNVNNGATLMNSNKMNTVDQKLLKRIYESTLKKSPVQGSPLHNKPGAIPKIANDMFNSLAYDDQLQFKLEKYLEFVCLKSSTFSKTNFSYVDYKS